MKRAVDVATLTTLATMLSVLLGGCIVTSTTGCGPSTPSIQAVVQQAVEAQTASILSQVDWKQVMTALEGKVGPETVIEAEGYIKQSAGMTIRIHGGELSFRTQASGTGGKDNSDFMREAVMPVLQRWENADNLNKQQRQKLAQEVTEAIIKYFEAKEAAKSATPAAPAPSTPTATDATKAEPPK